MRRTSILLLLVATALPAHAQQPPCSAAVADLGLSPETAAPGDSVRVTGSQSGALAGSSCPPAPRATDPAGLVVVRLDGRVVGTVRPAATGPVHDFAVTIRVPAGLDPGRYVVSATERGFGGYGHADLRVAGTLPRTGRADAGLVRLGVLLVAAGLAVSLGAGRSRTRWPGSPRATASARSGRP